MMLAWKSRECETQAVVRHTTAKDLATSAKPLVQTARNSTRNRGRLNVLQVGRTDRHQAPTAATAALTTFATSRTCFIWRPFVCRALFVGGATTFTSYLALLLTTHRSKPATFFARSVHSTPLPDLVFPARLPIVQTGRTSHADFKACASASRTSSAGAEVHETGRVPKQGMDRVLGE